MTFKHDGYNWIVRLDRGEKLVESLLDLVRRQGLPNCWVHGLGASSEVELGYYDIDTKQYTWKKHQGMLEITNLQGNIVGSKGDPQLHLHGTFASQAQAIGGHVKELVVGATCELLLHQWYGDSLMRHCDQATGLNLLSLEQD